MALSFYEINIKFDEESSVERFIRFEITVVRQ